MKRWSPSPILLAYLAALLLFLAVSLYSPGFANPAHVATLVTLASFIGIVAIGQTLVIVGGGIDLSVPWILNSAAILVTALAHGQNWPLVWIVPLILLFGCAVGVINGVGIALLRVPPIVMTMSVNVITQGLLLIVTRGFPPPLAPKALTFVAAGKLGPVPVMLLVWVVLAGILVVLERRTAFGRYLYAVGSNRTVATLSGVPIVRTTITAYAPQRRYRRARRNLALRLQPAGLPGHGRPLSVHLNRGGRHRRRFDPWRYGLLSRHHRRGACADDSHRGAADLPTRYRGPADHLRPRHPRHRHHFGARATRAIRPARLDMTCTIFQRRNVNVTPSEPE